MPKYLVWIIHILAGLIVAVGVICLIRKIVFKKEKVNFLATTAIGIALTAIGVFFVRYFNRIMKFFGINIPIDTEPITPSELKNMAEEEGKKAKEKKLNELENKTPDDVIDGLDNADDIRATIDDGKRKIDDLFHPGGMGGIPDKNRHNTGGNG